MPDERRVETVSSAEQQRLDEARETGVPWKQWGPYLSELQWGTVREDYSENGDAWNYFTHDQARSRAYHWGEDGLAGISDDHQRLCFAFALWNGKDPILKERLFGEMASEFTKSLIARSSEVTASVRLSGGVSAGRDAIGFDCSMPWGRCA